MMARLHYLGRWLWLHKVPVLPRLCMLLIRLLWGSFVPYRTKIGPNCSFGHGMGIVIAEKSVIGAGCKIRHQVTLADSGDGAPILGNGVFVGAGAKIIGNVMIGDGAKIGANSVVTRDVLAGCTAVGAPAHMVVRKPWAEITRPPLDISYFDARN